MTAVTLMLAACASQGPLQPPSLRLPARVQRLAAERSGDRVALTWTSPARTTDGLPLVTRKHTDGPFAAEICRQAADAAVAAAVAAAPCVPFARVPVVSGAASSFQDRLPDAWTHGGGRALRYSVRVVNASGRGAGYSDVLVAAGEPPAAMTELRAVPSADGGVTLRWAPGPGGDRVLLKVVRGAQAETEDLLAVDAAETDPGGAVDRGAKPGVAQRYTAFRTRMVSLQGQALAVHGAEATVTVAADMAAEPAGPPPDLDGVANTLGEPEIDLVWQPSADAGAVAYRVFRAEAGGPMQVLAGAEVVKGFSYADASVSRGVEYRYRVASLNAQGVAGRPGVEIRRVIPRP